MDKTVRIVTDLDEQQAETYRYWQSRSSSERFQATWELSRDLYREYNRKRGIPEHVEGSARSLTRIERPER
jgi:hypothetical protein